MFETDIVLWLQSFASDALTAVMVFLSDVGEARPLLGAALVVAFGYNFRIGAGLFQIILWNGFIADILKHLFALPRPGQVDATVQLLGLDEANESPFVAADGDDFFDLPKPEAIEHVRDHADGTFGFPSGHVSRATALGIAASIMWKSRTVGWLAAVFVVGTAVSRMYLGRHFLADVFGGLLLGLLTVLAARMILRTPIVRAFLRDGAGARTVAVLLVVAGSLPVLFLVLSDFAEFKKIGRLAGANIAFALLLMSGIPRSSGPLRSGVARAVVALLFYGAVTEIAQVINERVLTGDGWDFLLAFAPPFAYLLGTAAVLRYAGLYPAEAMGGVVTEAEQVADLAAAPSHASG